MLVHLDHGVLVHAESYSASRVIVVDSVVITVSNFDHLCYFHRGLLLGVGQCAKRCEW